jgi:hypothetical protein
MDAADTVCAAVLHAGLVLEASVVPNPEVALKVMFEPARGALAAVQPEPARLRLSRKIRTSGGGLEVPPAGLLGMRKPPPPPPPLVPSVTLQKL